MYSLMKWDMVGPMSRSEGKKKELSRGVALLSGRTMALDFSLEKGCCGVNGRESRGEQVWRSREVGWDEVDRRQWRRQGWWPGWWRWRSRGWCAAQREKGGAIWKADRADRDTSRAVFVLIYPVCVCCLLFVAAARHPHPSINPLFSQPSPICPSTSAFVMPRGSGSESNAGTCQNELRVKEGRSEWQPS